MASPPETVIADERCRSADCHEQIVDAHVVRVVAVQRLMARDRLRVVAGNAVEVAALQEDDEAVAGAVDAAVADRVGDEPRTRSTSAHSAHVTEDALMASDALDRSFREVEAFRPGRQVVAAVTSAFGVDVARSLLRTR